MEQDVDRLARYYENEHNEDNRLVNDRTNMLEYLTTMRYLKEFIPQGSTVLDACAGSGVYAFDLARAGYIVTAGDVTLPNVDIIKQKQAVAPVLNEIYCGNILDLSRFSDESFDAVLNLGAYYHMTEKSQRDKSIMECKRILKKGGIFFLAYLSRFSNFIKYRGEWLDDFSKFERLAERGYSDDDSLFFTITPEDAEADILSCGLKIIKNVATNGMKYVFRDTVNALPEDVFEKFLKCHFKMCEMKSLLGYSEHCLLIGRKV